MIRHRRRAGRAVAHSTLRTAETAATAEGAGTVRKGGARGGGGRAMRKSRPTATVTALTLVAGAALTGCGLTGHSSESVELSEWFTVTSPAFRDGGQIPARFGCSAYSGGQGKTPPLRWSGAPADKAAIAIVVDDPDAADGAYVHWVITNIDGTTNQLVEGARPPEAVEGQNSDKKTGYIPPCPPKGERHRYRFTIYALKERVSLQQGASLKSAIPVLAKNTIGRGRITGYFGEKASS